jgi:hypothetical protein
MLVGCGPQPQPTGYIHLSKDGGYFVYDGGARFVPHSWDANRIWHRTPGRERWRIPDGMDYTAWVGWLKEIGINSFRIRLAEGTHPAYIPGFEPPPAGSYNIWDVPLRYDDVGGQIAWDQPIPPDRYAASNITQIVRAAEQHGLKVMITFFVHTEVTSDWPLSAYNAEGVYPNGDPVPIEYRGVITDSSQFWIDPQAIEFQKRRIDFIMRNWGDSESIWAWEIMNESNFTASSEAEIRDMVVWVKSMAQYVKSTDPHHRPVTVSSVHLWRNHLPQANGEEEDERLAYLRNTVFEGAEIDIVNWHNYDVHTLPGRLEVIRDVQAAYGKPLMIGEFGAWGATGRPARANEGNDLPASLRIEDSLKADPPFENPPYYNSQESIWLGVVTLGGNGTAVRWHRFAADAGEDYLNEPPLYRPTARFMSQVNWSQFVPSHSWEDRVVASGADFVAAQGDGRQVLMMLRGLPDADPDTPDVQVTVNGLPVGVYDIGVFDWLSGERDPQRSQSGATSDDGALRFALDMSAYRKTGAGVTDGAATVILYIHPDAAAR